MVELTLNELLRPLVCPTTFGLSGRDKELDLVVTRGGARGDPYPIGCGPPMLFSPKPEPRRDPAADAARLMLEQNDMFDFLLEL
jgi:hypothetical protein